MRTSPVVTDPQNSRTKLLTLHIRPYYNGGIRNRKEYMPRMVIEAPDLYLEPFEVQILKTLLNHEYKRLQNVLSDKYDISSPTALRTAEDYEKYNQYFDRINALLSKLERF